MTFKKKIVDSSKWAILNQLVTQGIRIAVSVYMMRLLTPSSFGVFVKVLSIVGISEMLVGLRMGGGIVQSKHVTKQQLSTIFWLTLMGAVLLALTFFLSGNLIASFYDDTRLVLLTQAASVFVVFLGIGYVPRSILTKKLDYRSIFIVNLAGVTLSSGIGIWMALNGYDYWSLLGLWGSFNLIISVFYLLKSRFVPTLSLRSDGIHSLWKFSRKIALNDSLNYIARNFDNIVIGRVLGAQTLGLYSRAYNIMLFPLQNFVNILNGVLFPSFSLIQDDLVRIKEIFYKAIQSISFITLPFMLFAWLYAPELVLTVLGQEWQEIVGILRILLILGVLQIHSSFSTSIFLAMGRSDLPLKVSYIAKPILIVVILLTVNQGVTAVAIGVTVVSGASSLLQLILASNLINLSVKKLLAGLSVVWMINILVVIPFVLVSVYNPEMHLDLAFLLLALTLILVFNYLIFEFVKPDFYLELRSLIFKRKED
jgi:O-antigen/teichoic acid export membrane protein